MAYTTATALRLRVPVLASDRFTDTELDDYIAEFEELVENYRGVAFEPRTATETVDLPDSGATGIVLDWPQVRSITSVVVDGDTVDDETYRLDSSGRLVPDGTATVFTGTTLTVTYSHGLTEPGPALLRACREYVRATALADRSNVGRDVIRQSAGEMTTQYSTPNPAEGRPTGFLEVDRLINLQPNYRSTVGAG